MEYDLITVAETEPFQRRARRLLSEDGKANLSMAERNILSSAVRELVKNWSREK
jgi:hypothetical protein